MNVIIFGATGMVGQGVLHECLRDDRVERVLVVGRTPVASVGVEDPKVREIVRADLTDLGDIEDELSGYDACFFCLGVSSVGMKEDAYRRITYDLTMAAARPLARLSPGMTFTYVSGVGTDSSERGRSMWARVKGKTENDLIALFPHSYMFRPGYIRPMPGVVSKTVWYRALYAVLSPLHPVLERLIPGQVTTSEELGRAMIEVAVSGADTRVLGPREFNAVAARR
jgi:uncharacterized protein YbjT (DUF2867 family)